MVMQISLWPVFLGHTNERKPINGIAQVLKQSNGRLSSNAQAAVAIGAELQQFINQLSMYDHTRRLGSDLEHTGQGMPAIKTSSRRRQRNRSRHSATSECP